MNIKAKRIIANIAFYLVLAIIYGIAITAIIAKFNKGTIYVFNNRFDVVLTDSMSVRNENHAEYLSDTKQIQPFDIVVSSGIKDDTEIKEKDCVLFYNPNYNNELVVHRVVHIYEEGISFKVNGAVQSTFNGETVFSLESTESEVLMDTLDYSSITVTAYTPNIESSYLVISEGKNVVPTTVETTSISENVYKHVITYTRKSTAPYRTSISRGTDKDVYISSITYETYTSGTLTFNASELKLDESHNYKKLFNGFYLYEIRADKSNSSDGVFTRDKLVAKVNTVIPKIGHVTHFLQSLPGIIMLVGLTILITVASFFWNKNVNKSSDNKTEESTQEEINKNDKK